MNYRKVAGEIRETLTWLNDQLPKLKYKFALYLKFRTWIYEHTVPEHDICRSFAHWSIMARRTALKAWDKRLLERIRRGKWSAAELQWVLTHLDQRLNAVVQEIHEKTIPL